MKFSEHKPIFKQIADYMLDQVISAQWKEGGRIPSVREMAADVEVNPNTVARTYTLLSNLGIIYNQRGIGYFIELDAKQKAQDIKKKEFIDQVLPDLFNKMNLLEIDINQIKKYYNDFQSKKK